MSHNDHGEKTDAAPTLEHVLTRTMLKLKSGEDVDYDALEARNPHIMPELGKRLHDFRLFKKSVNKAKRQQPRPEEAIHDPEPDEDMASLGAALPEYEMIERIDRGGQGAVYRAYHGPSRQMVAVKLLARLPSSSAAQRGRFEREVALLKRLEHPNIISLTGHGLLGGRPYLITDYIDGLTLNEYVMFHDLPVRSRVELFVKVCDAVHAAHQKGVLHRDLKPANIIVDVNGEPRVLDFGLAKDLAAESGERSSDWTSHHRLVGTLPYLSPEQASQAVETGDVRSDVYTLGVMLFQVITSTMPYSVDGDARSVQRRILEEKPRRLREALAIDGSAEADGYEASISDDLESILAKTLSKQPDARYRSAAHLAEDLRRYLDGQAVEAKSGRRLYALGRGLRRNKAATAGGATFLLACGVLIGMFLNQFVPSQPLDSWNSRLREVRVRQAVESVEGLAPAESERVLLRATADPIRLDEELARVAAAAGIDLLEWMEDPDHPNYYSGQLILDELSGTLDAIAQVIEGSPAALPMEEGVDFAMGRDLGALPDAYVTSLAFVARANRHLHEGDAQAAVADWTTARLLATDMAGWTRFHQGDHLGSLVPIYRCWDRAILMFRNRDEDLGRLVASILGEARPPLEDLSAVIEYRVYSISELLQACCANRGDRESRIDIARFMELTGLSLSDVQREFMDTASCQEVAAPLEQYSTCMEGLAHLDHDSLESDEMVCTSVLGGRDGNNPLQHFRGNGEQLYSEGMEILDARSRVRIRAIGLRHRLTRGRLPTVLELRDQLPTDADRICPMTKEPWTDEQLADILTELADVLGQGD